MQLDKKDVDYILSLKPDDITRELMINFFAYIEDDPPRFKPNDTFTLPSGKAGSKTSVKTTIGRYIFNLFVLSPKLLKFIGYQNETIDKKYINEMESQISELLLNGDILADDFIDYLDRLQWLGFANNDFLCPSISLNMIRPNEKVMKRKKELVDAHRHELEMGDVVLSNQIEKELIELAREQLKDDPSMDIFDSGAKANFNTDYKATNIMKGAIENNATGEYHISTSNYINGIEKEEYAAYADTIVNAAYSRAVETRESGYETKKMFAAFQTVVLGPPGSDCLSKNTLPFIMSKSNYNLFLYRYIVVGSKLILLDNSNIKSYIGKVIHLRSPLFCRSEKICSKCAGELYYKLEIENIGLTTAKLSSSLLNMSLKVFHDASLDLYKIDYKEFME